MTVMESAYPDFDFNFDYHSILEFMMKTSPFEPSSQGCPYLVNLKFQALNAFHLLASPLPNFDDS
jgi:hypothetical protein